MSLKKFVLFLFLFFQISLFSFSQDTKELDKLDEIAFSALENNEADVIEKAQHLLSESKKTKSALHEINAYTILGIVNKNKGYYITSVDHYIKALNAAERINDNGRISACYNNIGTVYQLQENYAKALYYFQKSLELEEALNNPLQKSIRLYNMGEVYSELDSMDLALTYFNNSLLIEKKHNNSEGIIYALLGIVDVYISIDRLTDASITLDEAQKKQSDFDVEASIILYKLKGKFLTAKNDYDGAFSELQKALTISTKYGYRVHLQDIYLQQIEILKAQENWKKASAKYQEYIDLNNELNSIKVKNQLEDLTFQNELNKKELEIKLVQEERDLAQRNVDLEKKNVDSEKNIAAYETRIIWFLIFSIVIIVVLIIIGIKRITNIND